MSKNLSRDSRFRGLKIAITGANGSLGRSLIKEFKNKGAYVLGLTQSKKNYKSSIKTDPDKWISWSCGDEKKISSELAEIDILILNHGFNPKGIIDSNEITKSLEINSLSHWRLIQIFENLNMEILNRKETNSKHKEIWINTSEAEIQIAFSPIYEITKRLIGELVSLKKSELLIKKDNSLIIKKLILGPFKSGLNPYGVMSSDFVASEIIKKCEKDNYLTIVTPNPFTYLFMPIVELIRLIYSRTTNKLFKK